MSDGVRPAVPTDVLVFGGGPAGIATAMALARAGIVSHVLERSAYDAWRVGEHLSPDCRPELERLGIWPRFVKAGHVPSDGIRIAWDGDALYERDYLFNPFGNGWNLDRRHFDATLAAHAAACGIAVLTGTRLAQLDGEAGRWTCRLRGGSLDGRHISGRVLVDATGRSASIARRLGARRRVRDRLVGLCARLASADGRAAELDGSRLLVEAVESGWWYAASLPGRRLAAVFMSDRDLMAPAGKGTEATWDAQVKDARHVSDRMRRYERRVGFEVRAANSYDLEPAAGAGWLAVGDAAMAMDPLSSMGILGALRAGVAAAGVIARHLSGDRDALASHARNVARDFDGYLANRQLTYAQETRWPDHPFWRRRQALGHGPAAGP